MKHLIGVVIICITAHTALANPFNNRVKIERRSSLKAQDINTEEFNQEKQNLLARKRSLLIQDIKKFIRESQSGDQKAELNLRLGKLYIEEYYYLMGKSQAKYDKESKSLNGKKVSPVLDTSEAMASLEKARTLYKDILSRFPSHPRKDELLYSLAILSLDKGNNNEAVSLLKRIEQETPSSKYVADALIQIGDFYFEANNFKEAEFYFSKAINRKDGKTLPYATYKKAWCQYNTQHFQVSLALFKSLIEMESADNSKNLMRLKNEALRDIALPFAELHLANEAIAFYRSQGDTYQRSGLESMANIFLEKADYKNAILVNETLLSLDANGIKNPDYELAIIDALRASGNNDRAVARLFAQLPNYMAGSSWYELNSASTGIIKGASNRFEETARKYALELHAEGQKTKNDKLYETARSLYQKYLEFFVNFPHAQTIRFYLAEIQYKQGDFLAAADNYYMVYQSPTAGNLRVDSIHFALSALDREVNSERKKAGLSEISKNNGTKLKPSEKEEVATPLSSVEGKFISIGEEYVSRFPKASDTADILYQVSYLKYSHSDFPESYQGFWSVIQNYPSHPTSYSSAYLVLDILNRKKEYTKLVTACQKFLASSAFVKLDFKNDVSSVLRLSELKRIQQIEEKGSFKEAAQAYVEYTKAYGVQDEVLYEKALYNASVNFYKAEAPLLALEVQEQFLRRFTKSLLRENMLLQVAKTYESLANFEKSAAYYETFATQYPANKQSSSALRLAGLYYWGAKNEGKAESVMKTYMSQYPKDSSAVLADLLDLYETQGATDKQIKHYLESRAQRGISYAQYLSDTLKIAELQGSKTGRLPASTMEEALKVTQKFHKDLMQSKNGVEQSSKVLFWFAGQKEQVFYNIKLTLPERTLQINLKRKLALLKEIESEYSNIAKLGGGEWGLGAIYKTASAFRTIAQDIAQAPVPAELSGEELEQYRTELKRQMVVPFTEKALGLVGQCLEKAQEFNLLSHWSSRCYSLGSEISAERYPAIKTFFLPPYRVAVMANGKDSKTPMGTVDQYQTPFESTAFFVPSNNERNIASVESSLPMLIEGSYGFSTDSDRATPTLFSYKLLDPARKMALNKALQETKPQKQSNYGYLHYLRLTNPGRAVSSILESIQKDPNNIALHNLLGLCYMDLGQFTAARITWLSLLARSGESAEIQNNLGVLFSLMGKEKQSIEFFKAAAQKEGALEAWNNLGFVSLKYRNGFQAKQYFEKAAAFNDQDAASKVGFGIAKIQNREFDSAKDALEEASSTFKSDPFAKLSYAYLLMDVEKETAAAKQLLDEYARKQMNLDGDSLFRQAFRDLNRGGKTSDSRGDELPQLPD
jgi:tetratricopeptide (TPR) repeat protein